MGLINWFMRKRAANALKNMPEDKINAYVTEYLKRTQKEHANALRTAQTLNKASLLDMQTKKLKSEMKALLSNEEEDEEDFEEEDDEEEDFGDKIIKDLVSQFIKSKMPAGQQIEQMQKIAQRLTPEQKKLIKDKFGVEL